MNVNHVLGRLVALEPRQANLLSRIRDRPLMSVDDLRAGEDFDASDAASRMQNR